MTGYTTPDALPYPDDVNALNDVPTVNRALADATQAALVKKSPTTHTHPYSPDDHKHPLSVVTVAQWLPTIAAGAILTQALAVPAGAQVIVSPYGNTNMTASAIKNTATQWTLYLHNGNAAQVTGQGLTYAVIQP